MKLLKMFNPRDTQLDTTWPFAKLGHRRYPPSDVRSAVWARFDDHVIIFGTIDTILGRCGSRWDFSA